MCERQPDQVWWRTDEIADAKLPDLPASKRGVNMLADRMNWRAHPDFARRRKGRGGGWEYSWRLFPSRAQQALLAQVTGPEPAPVMERTEAWEWFDGLPETTKAKAQHRLGVIQTVEALERGGMTRDLACYQVARNEGISHRTIWNWLALIEGVRVDDRLPYLSPRNRAAMRGDTKSDCSPEFWDYLKADYLRLERPSFASCYRRAVRVAAQQGWDVLPERTMRRRLEEEVPALTITLCRKGVDALKALYPAQTRDRRALHAMEAVNADYHRFDVFVRWPLMEGVNEEEIIRPQLVAFQDIYSGRILSWRLDKTPNKVGVSLALGDMVERFGIPDHILLDNGREFANKFLTGQVPTRFRFKVRDDDIPGIMKVLGGEVHWATPYSGQSKPIERAFRDLCDDIAKDPRFAGAYTGNRPDAKPENYGSTAIPLDRFLAVIAEGIEEHNARAGRRGQTTNGRSILETFEASYATAPIRKATEEQRRLWLMGAEGVRGDTRTGLVRFMGNEYWSPWMHQVAGQKLVARFDPADLRAGLHIYTLKSEYLGLADCKLAAGFFDLEEARSHASARRKWMKAEKEAAEAQRKFKLAEIGDFLDAAKRPAPEVPKEAQVVRPAVFDRKPKLAPAALRTDEDTKAQEALIADFAAAKAQRPAKEEDARDRFKRALELEARLEADEPVTRDQERWLTGYRTTPEYSAQMDLLKQFGREIFG